jgi:hypothetical protein
VRFCQLCRRNCDPLTLTTTVDTLAEACFVSADRAECDDIQCRNLLAGWNSADRTRCDKYDGKQQRLLRRDGDMRNRRVAVRRAERAARAARQVRRQLRQGRRLRAGRLDLDQGRAERHLRRRCADGVVPDAQLHDRPQGLERPKLARSTPRNLPGRCDASANCQSDPSACSAVEGVQHIRCGDTNCLKNCDPGQSVSLLATAADVCQVNVTVAACPGHHVQQRGEGLERRDLRALCHGQHWLLRRLLRVLARLCRVSDDDHSGRGGECGVALRQCRVPPTRRLRAAVADRVVELAAGGVRRQSREQGVPGGAVFAACRRLGGRVVHALLAGFVWLLRRDGDVPQEQRVQQAVCQRQDAARVVRFAGLRSTDGVRREQRVDVVGQHRQGVLHRQPAQRLPDGCGVRRHWARACFRPQAESSKTTVCARRALNAHQGVCQAGSDNQQICCNVACTGECNHCVRGVCQAKVGAACSGGACRACDESGTCASKTTICAAQGNSTVLVGSGQFGCTAPNTCVAGMCRACTQPPAQPAVGVPIVAPPRVVVDCTGNVDCGFNTNSSLSKGSCVAGKCVCQNGYTGTFCDAFSCRAPNCNSANGGGVCTGANTCTCNSGFSLPDCTAECPGKSGCSGHGVCVSRDVCQCNPGFGGGAGDCAGTVETGQPCADMSACPSGTTCWKETPSAAMGVCCSSPCTGECNSCALPGKVGTCAGKVDAACGSAQCSVCRPTPAGDGLSVCEAAATTQCKSAGGKPGTDFMCLEEEFCFEGKCLPCMGSAITCPDTSASWSIDLLLANPTLGTLTTSCGSNGGANVTFSTGVGCKVVWVPSVGAGVDCSTTDNLLSAGETVIITLAPATNKLRLGFGNFSEGISRGKAKLVLAGMRRRQAAGTEYNITTAALEIDQAGIVGVEITADAGSFAVTKIDSIDTTSITANTTVLETTSATGNDTGVSTMDVGTEGERGFIERLQDGFRGEDDVYLGGFIGVLLFLVCIIVAVIVAVVMWRRNKRQSQTLYDAYNQGKPMQSFETVTAKPSAAINEDSDDDDQPLGILSTPTLASQPSSFSVATNDEAPRVGIKVEPLTDSEDDGF